MDEILWPEQCKSNWIVMAVFTYFKIHESCRLIQLVFGEVVLIFLSLRLADIRP